MKVAVVLRRDAVGYEALFAVFVKDSGGKLWSSFKRTTLTMRGKFARRTTLERYGYTVHLCTIFANRLPRDARERVPLFFESIEEFAEWCAQHAAKLFKTERAKERVLERLREAAEAAEQYEAPGPMLRRSKYKAVKLAVFEQEEPPSYVAIRRAGRAVYDAGYEGMLREYSGSYLVFCASSRPGRPFYNAHYLFVRKANVDGAAFAEELAEMSEEDRKVVKELLRRGLRLAERAGRRDIADLFVTLLSLGELLLD